jgi:hypothetical protein
MVEPGSARMVNFPSTSVILPSEVPLTTTLTPGNPSGSSKEVIRPETCLVCACAKKGSIKIISKSLYIGKKCNLAKDRYLIKNNKKPLRNLPVELQSIHKMLLAPAGFLSDR